MWLYVPWPIVMYQIFLSSLTLPMEWIGAVSAAQTSLLNTEKDIAEIGNLVNGDTYDGP